MHALALFNDTSTSYIQENDYLPCLSCPALPSSFHAKTFFLPFPPSFRLR